MRGGGQLPPSANYGLPTDRAAAQEPAEEEKLEVQFDGQRTMDGEGVACTALPNMPNISFLSQPCKDPGAPALFSEQSSRSVPLPLAADYGSLVNYAAMPMRGKRGRRRRPRSSLSRSSCGSTKGAFLRCECTPHVRRAKPEVGGHSCKILISPN